MNSLFAGMYMMFFTTKLTRTTTFALLNQRYYNLLYQTIYQSCIFQGYSCRSPCYNDIVASIPCYIYWVYLVKVVFFLGTAKSTARSKTRNVRMLGGNKQIFRMDIDWELHLHGWVF